MSDKLPERPQEPRPDDYMLLHAQYWMGMSDFHRARMEALVKHARHMDECQMNQRGGFRCTCGLSELLAACERGKS